MKRCYLARTRFGQAVLTPLAPTGYRGRRSGGYLGGARGSRRRSAPRGERLTRRAAVAPNSAARRACRARVRQQLRQQLIQPVRRAVGRGQRESAPARARGARSGGEGRAAMERLPQIGGGWAVGEGRDKGSDRRSGGYLGRVQRGCPARCRVRAAEARTGTSEARGAAASDGAPAVAQIGGGWPVGQGRDRGLDKLSGGYLGRVQIGCQRLSGRQSEGYPRAFNGGRCIPDRQRRRSGAYAG